MRRSSPIPMQVNVGGTVNCLAPLIAAMLTRRQGQIAINASLAGYNGLPGGLAYGSSKAALIHMAESLAADLRGQRIEVSGPLPRLRAHADDRSRDGIRHAVDDRARRRPPRSSAMASNAAASRSPFPGRSSTLSKFVKLLPYPLRFAVIGAALRRASRQS